MRGRRPSQAYEGSSVFCVFQSGQLAHISCDMAKAYACALIDSRTTCNLSWGVYFTNPVSAAPLPQSLMGSCRSMVPSMLVLTDDLLPVACGRRRTAAPARPPLRRPAPQPPRPKPLLCRRHPACGTRPPPPTPCATPIVTPPSPLDPLCFLSSGANPRLCMAPARGAR